MISTDKTERYDAIQIESLKDKVDDLDSAEKDKTLKYRNQLNSMGEEIEKLKMEKAGLQENVDVAHITISKNLEKIRQLEATKNHCSGGEKHSEEMLFKETLLNANLKKENCNQDLSLKEEYMENTSDAIENLLVF